MFNNIPEVKLGLIAVSRDCFVISLSERRRAAVAAAYEKLGGEIYECKVTVENEKDMLRAVEDVKAAGCTALVEMCIRDRPPRASRREPRRSRA